MKSGNIVPSAFAVRQTETGVFSCPVNFAVTVTQVCDNKLWYEQPGHGQSWRNIRQTYLYCAALSKKIEAPSNYSQWAYSPWCNKHQTKTKTIKSKSIVVRQMHELQQCLLPKTRYRLDNPRWWTQQNFLLQRQHPSPQKWEQKTGTIN